MGTRGLRWWVGVVPAVVLAAHAGGQQPPASTQDLGKRVAAYVHGNSAITRDDLGDYLIARGGMDKIDHVVNRRIVETEAARRGITVTALEIGAAVNDDLQSSGVSRDDFARVIQKQFGKTPYEWEQDVVRQRLLLGKMARERVKVTDDDLRKEFENRHGERREAFVIKWPTGKDALPASVKQTALESQAEFEKLAARQPNELAKGGGRINPIGRHLEAEDPRVMQALFELKAPGEARWVETETMSTCVRLVRVVPPDAGVTFEQVRANVEKEVFDRKLSRELPKVFDELRTAARPVLTQHVPPRPGSDPNARVQHPDPRVLAVLYGNLPVTRTDLGEFLIARGGFERLESLVHVRIVEIEAGKRNVTATPEEIEAALLENLKPLNVTRDDFVNRLLPKAGKTLAEYVEDEVRPTVLLGKMCRDKVAATDDDLKKAFERRYGEKRDAKIILWGKDEFRRATKEWDTARQGDAQFDAVARAQNDPNLAASAGRVAPIGRHGDAPNPLIEKVVFELEPGGISQLFQTPAGILCIKCVGVVPPVPGVKLEGAVRAELEKEVVDRKMGVARAELFAALRAAANPNLILRGPPTERENQEGVQQIINQVGPPAPKR